MDYFKNRNYKSGLSIVFVAGAISIFAKSDLLTITAGVLAIIGLGTMFYGMKQHNESEKKERN